MNAVRSSAWRRGRTIVRQVRWNSLHTVATLVWSGLLAATAHAADGDFLWVKQIGGPTYETVESIAVDDMHNVYATGYFSYTIDFDPGPGTANLTAAGGLDIFVLKLDSSGNFVWAADMGGPYNNLGHAVAVDHSGNVYATGTFRETVDFDPGPGTAYLTATGNGRFDSFVSKLDSSGNFVWARQLGGYEDETGTGIALDDAGNVCTAGFFGGTADFDPGPDTANLTALGVQDIYVSKLDTFGNFVWAKRVGGPSIETAEAIAVNTSGSVHVVGTFQQTVDFDPGPGTTNLTSAGSYDVFVLKLDTSGNFLWARGLGGNGRERCVSVAVDALGNVYTTGSFQWTADFDPGPGTANLTAAGGSDPDIFLSKLDTLGNFVWVRQLGGTDVDWAESIAVDTAGNVYTTGLFYGTGDFDPGVATANLTSEGGSDVFVSKLDRSGDFVWAKRMGGTSFNRGTSVAARSSGDVFTAGKFQGVADFDPGPEDYTLTSAGGTDIFVARFSGVLSVWSVTLAGIPNGWSVEFTVVFSEPVTGVDLSDFLLTTTGTLTGASVTSVTGSGATYTVTVNIGTGVGTLRLDVTDDDSIINGASEPLGGAGAGNGDFTMGEVYNIDKALPMNWFYLFCVLALAAAIGIVRLRREGSRD